MLSFFTDLSFYSSVSDDGVTVKSEVERSTACFKHVTVHNISTACLLSIKSIFISKSTNINYVNFHMCMFYSNNILVVSV